MVINLTRIAEVKIRLNKPGVCLRSYLGFKQGMTQYQCNNLDLHSWISAAGILSDWEENWKDYRFYLVKCGIQNICRIFKWTCLHSRRPLFPFVLNSTILNRPPSKVWFDAESTTGRWGKFQQEIYLEEICL